MIRPYRNLNIFTELYFNRLDINRFFTRQGRRDLKATKGLIGIEYKESANFSITAAVNDEKSVSI